VAAVTVEPVTRSLLPLLRVFAPWTLVVVGRRVCLGAQRVPPLVRLVRFVRERQQRRRQEETAGISRAARTA
jgi:hypothetical protein